MPHARAALAAAVLLTAAFAAHADNWPGWRGPRGDGTTAETAFPLRWSETENLRWKVEIPGRGHSSPCVWGDRVYLTTCVEADGKRLLLCLNRADGKPVWERVVQSSPLEQKHQLNSFASSTPATDGRRVYCTFLDRDEMRVYCYDLDGNPVWQRKPGKFFSKHGFCSPPVLYKDTVILNGDQDAEAYIVALNKVTGDEVWRADRPNRTRSYCTPLIVEAAGKTQLILSGSKSVASYDPGTGKQYWVIDGPTEQFVAGPVYDRGVVFITGGFPTYHLLGVKPDGTGNVTNTHVMWHHKRDASYVPSPVAHNGFFFVVTDKGLAMCLDPASGKIHWRERLGTHHSPSAVAAGGHVYFPGDDGTTYVVKASSKFEVVARNRVGDEFSASPALSDGQIFLRGAKYLYCVGSAGR